MARLKFISIEDVLEMQANNEPMKIVEVLKKQTFDEGHLPGAINIPLDKLEEQAPKLLSKADTIVVYCASYTCHTSTKALQKLLELGYSKAVDFKAGKKGWIQAGLDLERDLEK